MADAFNLGRHEALISELVKGQSRIIDRLDAIDESLAERRGERRLAMGLWASGSGAFGALVAMLTKAYFAGHTSP